MTTRSCPQPRPRHGLSALLTLAGAIAGLATAHAADTDRTNARRQARNDAFVVGAKVSTLGLGADLTRSFAGRRLALRVGYNGFSYDFDGTESGIDYAIDLELGSVELGAEWHPTGGGAFLSAGVLLNDNVVNARGEPDDLTIEIGDETFLVEDVGTLTGNVAFDDVSPMVGLGWNGSFGRRRFGIAVSGGVVFHGEPRVTLQADGLIADEPAFQEELAREIAQVQEEIEGFTLYPVASFALTWRF